MDVKIYNQAGQETGKKVPLPEEVFCVKVNEDLLHQVVVAQQANQRQNTAQTKDRSERRGGGRKPWRQKGTGRARHGSIRSPLWRGGGVTFGPRNKRNYKKTVQKKMRRKALFMALSSKVKDKELIVLEELQITKPSTKTLNKTLQSLPCENKSVLLVVPGGNKDIVLSGRNLPDVAVRRAQDLNALEVLRYKYLLMLEPAIKAIKDTFVK